jgi:DNA-binding NarL/FixJ family response regulator
VNPIRVLLVDDQEIITRGLKMILDGEQDIEVIGTAANGQEAYRFCCRNRPDVVLMDIKMPMVNGVEATDLIKRDFPGTRILVLTTFNDDEYIFEALRKGACGYLLKETPPDEIAKAIREAYRGGSPIQPRVASRVVERFTAMASRESPSFTQDEKVNLLTDREKSIVALIGRGRNNKEIARELYLSEGTVRNYLSSILNKLGLRDRTQLAIFAVKNHLA